MERYVRPHGSPPVSGYSHAVVFGGPMVAISGQLPLDDSGELVGDSDPEAQVRQVFVNLGVALAAAACGFENLVKLTVFMTDLADLGAFRRIRDEYIDPERPPASSLVQITGLVHPGARIEIEALAETRR